MPIEEVNNATLELLERRISSNVRSDFLKSVTIPIGGGGLLAIVVSVFFWIPTKVEALLAQPEMAEQITTLAEAQVKEEIKDDIALAVSTFMTSPQGEELLASAVTEAFSTPTISDIVETHTKDAVSSDSGKASIALAVQQAFEDEEVKGMIKTTVRDALKPTTVALRSSLEEKSTQLVQTIATDAVSESKGEVALDAALSRIKHTSTPDTPVILNKDIGADFVYVRGAILLWNNEFRRAFGDRFRYISIHYKNPERGRSLLALIPHETFIRMLEVDDSLIELLNAKHTISPEEARSKLALMFGNEVLRQLDGTSTIASALTKSGTWFEDAPEVPVTGKDGLSGLTTRRTLEDYVLSTSA